MFDLFSGLFFNVPMYIFSNPSDPFRNIKGDYTKQNYLNFFVPTFFSNFVRYSIIDKPIKYLSRIISGGDFFLRRIFFLGEQNKKNQFSMFGVQLKINSKLYV